MTRYAPDSQTPAIKVMTVFLVVTSTLGVLARLGTKWWKFGSFFQDDYFIMASLLMSMGQSVAVSVAVNTGYGEHITKLTETQVDIIMRCQYAATFLYILSICFSKLSILCFVRYLTPTSQSRWIFIVLQIAIVAWTLVGIFASAFQCHHPQWDYIHGICYNREAWFIYLAASNIVSDVLIVAQAVRVIAGIQTGLQRKMNIISVFLFRLLVTWAIVAQLALVHRTINSADPTSDTWSTAICTQLVQCLSIITACAPQFVPFLKNLQSSGMRLDGITRHTHSSQTYASSRNKYLLLAASQNRTGNESYHELHSLPKPATRTTITTAKAAGAKFDQDNESQSSQTQIIHETRTWTVTEERLSSPEHDI